MRKSCLAGLLLMFALACATTEEPDLSAPSPTSTVEPIHVETLHIFLHSGNTEDCAEVVEVDRVVDGPPTLESAMQELLAGPTDEEAGAGLAGWFTEETRNMLISAELQDDVARVDFADLREIIPNASTSCGSAMLLAQLDRTAEQFGASRTLYSIDGDRDTFYEWLQMGTPVD